MSHPIHEKRSSNRTYAQEAATLASVCQTAVVATAETDFQASVCVRIYITKIVEFGFKGTVIP